MEILYVLFGESQIILLLMISVFFMKYLLNLSARISVKLLEIYI